METSHAESQHRHPRKPLYEGLGRAAYNTIESQISIERVYQDRQEVSKGLIKELRIKPANSREKKERW